MDLLSAFSKANSDYIENLYQQYQQDPDSVDPRWAGFFEGFEAGGGSIRGVLETLLPSTSGSPAEGINHLVHSYREFGHYDAHLDPLGNPRPPCTALNLSVFGFSQDKDLGMQTVSGGFKGPYDGTLGGLVQSLRKTYSSSIGVEFVYISDTAQKEWLIEKMEPVLNQSQLDPTAQKALLAQLVRAEGFEQYLHTKYVGQKRFSVQGLESSVCLLETLVSTSAELGASEVLMGMAHRGRLNLLAHVLRKPYEMILREFEGTVPLPEDGGDGDVKYHLGFSSERKLESGRSLRVTLSSNPSHLELVNPVIEGMVRARQHALEDEAHERVIPILVHGEAAFTGQGIVPETLSLSELPGYRTGGTIHVILNNQVGFTANPSETRFTPYPTDVAKMIQAPVFHVNADDPEAVVTVAKIAMEFRQKFKIDVMIDLWGYRKYGHNETDDPTFTQPVMYKKIEKMVSVRDLYAGQLIEKGVITADDVAQMKSELKSELDRAWEKAKDPKGAERISPFTGLWKDMTRAKDNWDCKTRLDAKQIESIGEVIAKTPDDFHVHPKIRKLLESRREMANGQRPIDWGCAESWAFGSLLNAGVPIRLTGQDVCRGTFSHRHAVLYDFETGASYLPLRQMIAKGADLTIVNTMLSELAVVGFEYGYSTTDPRNLVIWEAQFGDFANGAQAIFDQFLASAESKWEKMSGMVILLPHGYEGQGPEHSSARLERILQLCAENNIQVAYPSLPSQYFHLLRRQMLRSFRKPLFLMMPKSLLRDERHASALEEFSERDFSPVLDDSSVTKPTEVTRVILCSGKVFFSLLAQKEKRDDIAILRVEQLYPFPERELKSAISKYSSAEEFFWVQEEPENMGPWRFIQPRLKRVLHRDLQYCGRGEAASPAHGHYKVHHAEEHEFIEEALGVSKRIQSRRA